MGSAGMTAADLDTRLLAVRDLYIDAVERCDVEAAQINYDQLDRLLDQRLSLPLPRAATV